LCLITCLKNQDRRFNMKHIVLTGFMGSGKTTLGKDLAELLDIPFIDIDQEIERISGRTIPELFAISEAYFRKIEALCTFRTLEKEQQCVIALGGGSFCQTLIYEILKEQNHLTIYLDLTEEELLERLDVIRPTRPVLLAMPDEHWKTDSIKLYRERRPQYLKAKMHVMAHKITAQELKENIENDRTLL